MNKIPKITLKALQTAKINNPQTFSPTIRLKAVYLRNNYAKNIKILPIYLIVFHNEIGLAVIRICTHITTTRTTNIINSRKKKIAGETPIRILKEEPRLISKNVNILKQAALHPPAPILLPLQANLTLEAVHRVKLEIRIQTLKMYRALITKSKRLVIDNWKVGKFKSKEAKQIKKRKKNDLFYRYFVCNQGRVYLVLLSFEN
jgi:hypothetical protein